MAACKILPEPAQFSSNVNYDRVIVFISSEGKMNIAPPAILANVK